jgi:hypothetical protein
LKVLDLQCAHLHVFEGWFASEEDFNTQSQDSRIECPLCGSRDISKRLSAPRLNLGHHRSMDSEVSDQKDTTLDPVKEQMASWLTLARQVLATADNVGDEFAQEARKMHHGETPERTIRGTATRQDAVALLDDGIEIVAFDLPDLLNQTLQ